MNDEIRAVLVQFPELIELKEFDLVEAKFTQEEQLAEKEYYMNAVNLDVEKDAKLDNFKESLSNASKRSAEVKKRLGDMSNYLNLCTQIDAQKKDVISKEIKLSTLKRKFRAAEALARLGE